MGSYSIKELEVLSGIKAHTIRIWEQRYNLIEPTRSDTNIRSYSDEDLRYILNVSILNQNGHKISKISNLTREEVNQMVLDLNEKQVSHPDQINNMVLAMIDIDQNKFERTFARCVLQFGFENTIEDIIYPFLEKIGIMWTTGNITPAHEHFISHLIRKKLFVAIDGIDIIVPNNTESFILYLPEGEFHELALLFSLYIVKSRGFKTIYLSQSLPFNDLVDVYKSTNAHNIMTILSTSKSEKELSQFMEKLSKTFVTSRVILCGHPLKGYKGKKPKNVHTFDKIPDFKNFIAELKTSALN